MAQYSNTSGLLNINIQQGDDLNILLTFSTNGTAIDLSSYTFTSYVLDDGAQEVAITVTETDLANGQITLSLTDTQTDALDAKDYDWYLKWTDDNSFVRTVLTGQFKVVGV